MLLAVTAMWTAGVARAASPELVDVFVGGEGGYHTYRIPALVVSNKGTLLAFIEGRKTSGGDHGDIDMMLRRSTDGGKTWLAMQMVYEEGDTKKVTIGNPCPVVDRDTGRIWLPFNRDNDDVLITWSDDDGVTWAKPRVITPDVKAQDWTWYATGPGVGIQIERGAHKGRLVIPCDHREAYKGKTAKMSHVFYSDDHGETWKLGGTVAPHTDECQVAERADGSLIINMRNYWERDGGEKAKGGKRAIATSDDGGVTWSALRFDETLIEPICQAGLVRVAAPSGGGKGLLVFTNPASTSKRDHMTVRISEDDGATWPRSALLYGGSSAYSCPTRLPDGRVGVLFERDGYRKATFAAFDTSWVGVTDK
ncbi:MAG: exo-alpha-sialidase [Phycisphaera sp.]|nr:exo-alpha-sialidase [Phycisphaera sp.]